MQIFCSRKRLLELTADMTKKISKVSLAHENALSRLENFHAERERLIKYIKELDSWLGSKENTLKTIEKTLRVENIGKCKEVNVELLTRVTANFSKRYFPQSSSYFSWNLDKRVIWGA